MRPATLLAPPEARGIASGIRWMPAPEVLVVAFLCALVLGQVAKVPLVSTDLKTARILLSDIVAAALAAWLFASVLVAGRIRLDRVTAYFAGFVAVNLLAIGVTAVRFDLTAGQVAFSALYLVRWSLYAAGYLFALTALRLAAAPRLIRAAVTACGVFAGFGIIQSIFMPNFAFIVYPDAIPYIDWDIQGHRLVSTFLDPNFAGAFIMFGLFFVHAQSADRRPSYPLLALFWVALILTLSRSSIIATLVGLSILTFRTRSFNRLLVPLAAFVLVAALAADRLVQFAGAYNKLTLLGPSALTRLGDWLLAWRIFIDNPLLGVGYNTFGIIRSAYGSIGVGSGAFGSDGGILYMAAVSGILGVALLGAGLWRLMALGWRTYQMRELPQSVRVLGLALHVWIPSLVIQSAASNSIFYPFIIGLLFLLGGVCARQYHEAMALQR
ncbi:MAG: O-antigen ligase family protein [Gemmatimonadota bacterium]|nr:O-antigen ligase family protein [Gemmatimonadota bacterium]